MFDWEDMRVFSVLAREGSLSGAARMLGVNHATVSRRVASLEQALNVGLVRRLARSTPLTVEGERIAALAAQMDDHAQAILRQARGATATLSGHVTIATSPMLANEFIIPGLLSLQDQHPALAIDILAAPQLIALERGEADLAVRLKRPEREDLVIRKLGDLGFALYASPEFAALPAAQWRFIGFDADLDHLPQQRWIHSLRGERPLHLRNNDLYGQQAAAEAGLGVACLPNILGLRSQRLVRVMPDHAPPLRELWLAIHADLRRSPAVRAVADHVTMLFETSRQLG